MILILIATLLVVVPVVAQDPGPNTIGLWFDADAMVNVLNDPQSMQEFSGYLVIHAATHTQIAGLECAIDVPDGVYCVDWEYPPGADNWGTPYNVIVSWWPALDPNPDLVVIRFDYLILTVPELPAFFVLGPTEPCSFPDTLSPGYAYFEGGDVLLQSLDYVYGDPTVARFESGSVAVESHSLTEVKNLFQ